MKSYIVIFVAMLLFFGCVNPPQPTANNTTYKPPVVNAANNSTFVSGSLPPGYSVSLGDTVWVDYTLRVDGKVYDTDNATLANESGIFNPKRTYQPLKFTAAFNKGIIDGFVLAVIGMRVNETLTFSVDPDRGYGPYDPKKVVVIPRYYNKSLHETVPRAYLEEQGVNITNGTGYQTNYGTVFVEDFNDENVTLFYILKQDDTFLVNGIPQKVVSVTNLTAVLEFLLTVNETYALPNPNTGSKIPYKVLDKTDENITLDPNHPLANKTLNFKVTLLKVERPN